MPLQVQVFSDYVCPYCFLAEGPLNETVAELDGAVEVEWMPFELRPAPTPTLDPAGDYLQSGWRDSVYPMAEQMGVHIVLPKVSPQPYTRLAFEGALVARDQGKAYAYNHRMFTSFFQDELDIGDANVLADCATEIGLDKQEFRSALDSGVYSKECEQQSISGAMSWASTRCRHLSSTAASAFPAWCRTKHCSPCFANNWLRPLNYRRVL